MKSLLPNILILCLFACTANQNKDGNLKGEERNGVYQNNYFLMKTPNGWEKQDFENDESQFLILVKNEGDFKSNLIFLVTDKTELQAEGFYTVPQYAKAFYVHNLKKVNFKNVSTFDSVLVNNRYFYKSAFSFLKDERTILQSFYLVEMDKYVLEVVATEDFKRRDPNIDKMIRTIIFKTH